MFIFGEGDSSKNEQFQVTLENCSPMCHLNVKSAPATVFTNKSVGLKFS